MRYMRFVYILFFLLVVHAEADSQVLNPSGGGNATGSGGSAGFTIGQVILSSGTDEAKTISQGFQQPYEILVVGIRELTIEKLDCSLYPNPATDYIRLKVEAYEGGDLYYKLFDMGGLILINSRLEGNEVMIPMQSQKPGTYLLKLSDGKQDLKIFKIIKR
ncbi:MAG: T9SS type A sorting domain-containing protein [Bacteroidetes bacterium]|nr:T9SS type A sorting domain-containing protein [Bacteroidota bacterium]